MNEIIYDIELFRVEANDDAIKFIYDFKSDNNDGWYSEYVVLAKEKRRLRVLLGIVTGENSSILYIDNLIV